MNNSDYVRNFIFKHTRSTLYVPKNTNVQRSNAKKCQKLAGKLWEIVKLLAKLLYSGPHISKYDFHFEQSKWMIRFYSLLQFDSNAKQRCIQTNSKHLNNFCCDSYKWELLEMKNNLCRFLLMALHQPKTYLWHSDY